MNEANRNTYMGMAAGLNNREGSDNVAIGAFADFDNWEGVSQADLVAAFDGDEIISGEVYDAPIGISWGDANRVVMIGGFANVRNDDGIALGYLAKTSADRAMTIGATASSTHPDAITIGYGAISHAADTAVIGNDTTVGWHPNIDAVTELGSPTYRFTNVTAQGFDAIAAAATPAAIELWADDGNGDDDKWQISAADSGDLTLSSFASGAYVAKLTVDNTGNVTIPGEISINSDARLKQNVRSIEDALSLVSRMDGKTFAWKPGPGRDARQHYGLIAQDVEAVLPELVSESDSGIKSVNYQAVVPVLINAVKDLNQTIECKNTELAELRSRVDRMEATLATLAGARKGADQ